MNADGSGQTQLTHEGFNYRPAISPNSRQVVYHSFRDGKTNIWFEVLCNLSNLRIVHPNLPLTESSNAVKNSALLRNSTAGPSEER
jgi:Tol biopolymer transport system component